MKETARVEREYREWRERIEKLSAEAPEGTRLLTIYAYEDWPNLTVYRCPCCGSTGPADSECGPHDGGVVVGTTSFPRRPCLVALEPPTQED